MPFSYITLVCFLNTCTGSAANAPYQADINVDNGVSDVYPVTCITPVVPGNASCGLQDVRRGDSGGEDLRPLRIDRVIHQSRRGICRLPGCHGGQSYMRPTSATVEALDGYYGHLDARRYVGTQLTSPRAIGLSSLSQIGHPSAPTRARLRSAKRSGSLS